jgi:maltose alpha-D-glucosyltransferase/alpha-amylase
MPRTGPLDPLWYKDAVIYELHVRGFHDSNGDGIGDFRGLIEKLDYLQELGITCIWLLPFFPSPLQDDGYDIADYTNVHPSYGTLNDFKDFLAAAHARDLQVMIELVINHTSAKHPWFQAARRAPPGSPEREYYVWSDSDQKYAGTRIIFIDTEKSNWTWDPEAKAYYWHRFFSHQPDLNFDNPAVVEEVIRVMRFWLDLGVDAMRLDAIPYLVEREGTNCENLPETHAVIKQIRAALDEDYAGRAFLAEANQWPSDVAAYFGESDECHMAFHFPLMPRLFMALRLEDRHPVTEIMAKTPPIPESCQWGLFLRNHDELTLEMVSDEERDYMYLAYSADPRMRINVGIRRRLAPLLENNRNRIELLNSILLSFPGTPILYSGDEIGMGDNIYLGDRHAVRTPMQWSADRNGGFSRANPARLYSPVIMDAVYGYEAVNVEAQRGEPSSVLNWTRRMLALRKLFQVFGRGTIEFLSPANRKILAYLRSHQGEQVLCVANLSRFAQPFELDLSALAGKTPIEMLGYVEFPRIGRKPYPLTLGPYGFLWFELHGVTDSADLAATVDTALEERVVLEADAPWSAAFEGGPRIILVSRLLPDFLPRQRWFGGKARMIESCELEDFVPLAERLGMTIVRVSFTDGGTERYTLILGVTPGAEGERLREQSPGAVVGLLTRGDEMAVLHDALASDDACPALLAVVEAGVQRPGETGALVGVPAPALLEVGQPEGGWTVHRRGTEQSNTSVIFGDRFILKLFRRIETGPNPDAEVTRYLSEQRGFSGVPRFAGLMEHRAAGQPASVVALVQALVPNQGDGWGWILEELGRFYERAVTLPGPPPASVPDPWSESDERGLPVELDELLGISDDAAAMLGRRTAEMHCALGAPTDDPAFAAEPLTPDDLAGLNRQVRSEAMTTFDLLRRSLPALPDEQVEAAGMALSHRGRLLELTRQPGPTPEGAKIRIHGDYHLGQVLRTGLTFVILDFEGEPTRSLEERRAKQSPVKDVAGMLRSFAYAARTGLASYSARHPDAYERLALAATVWERSVATVFLREYRQAVATAALLPRSHADFIRLLKLYLIEKTLYELRYELNNRPDWVHVPLAGVLALTG